MANFIINSFQSLYLICYFTNDSNSRLCFIFYGAVDNSFVSCLNCYTDDASKLYEFYLFYPYTFPGTPIYLPFSYTTIGLFTAGFTYFACYSIFVYGYFFVYALAYF
jgi:hypothetical protein